MDAVRYPRLARSCPGSRRQGAFHLWHMGKHGGTGFCIVEGKRPCRGDRRGRHQGNHCTFAPENHPDSRSRARNRGRRFLNPFRAWQQTVLQVKRISGIHTLSSAAASGGSPRICSHVCSGGVEGGIRRAACRIFSGSAFSYETCKRRKNEDGVREERTCGSAGGCQDRCGA